MKAATIHRLLGHIPDKLVASFCSGGRRDFDTPGSRTDPGVMRVVAAATQPDIGFRFCKFCALHGIQPPTLIDPEVEPLWRCWLYCMNPKAANPAFRGALAFMGPGMAGLRTTLQGLLLASGATHQNVAARLGMDTAIVRDFEVLFFNVLDRQDEPLYRQQLLYPDGNGRLEELNPGHLRSLPTELAMLRAGAQNGMDDVLYWLGASSKALDDLAGTNTAASFENLTVGYGALLARNGGLNQGRREAPGLAAAREIARQTRRTPEQSRDQAFFDLPLGMALKQEIIANQIPARFREGFAG